MITLVINGQPRQVKAMATVADYLSSLEIDSQHVAVAHNGEVVERRDYAHTKLNEGDRLEIVRPVGGG